MMLKIFEFLLVYKQWSKMYFDIFVCMSNSTEVMMSIDRGLYELHTGTNTNTAVLLIGFK